MLKAKVNIQVLKVDRRLITLNIFSEVKRFRPPKWAFSLKILVRIASYGPQIDQSHGENRLSHILNYVIHRLGGPYWEKLCLRSWVRAVLRPRAQFLPIRTDLGLWITFLFFSPQSFRKILLLPPNYVCWNRASSCWWSARLIANQNETSQHDF